MVRCGEKYVSLTPEFNIYKNACDFYGTLRPRQTQGIGRGGFSAPQRCFSDVPCTLSAKRLGPATRRVEGKAKQMESRAPADTETICLRCRDNLARRQRQISHTETLHGACKHRFRCEVYRHGRHYRDLGQRQRHASAQRTGFRRAALKGNDKRITHRYYNG